MNKILLMGRLTKDPEIRYTQTNNVPVANFTLAVNRRFVKPGEERQADFINIVAWNKLGEFCSKYFKKGQQVNIVGRLETRSWEDQEGQKKYATEVIAEEAYFADSKKETNQVPDEAPNPNFNPETELKNALGENLTVSSDDLPF